MQDESSTFGLDREKLAKLWQMGKDMPKEQGDRDKVQGKAELLEDRLAESLPLDTGMQHLLPEIVAKVCEKLKPFTGCSFKSLLLDPETDLRIIKTIKDLHKRQTKSASSELEQEVAAIIYYASIASALVHHDVMITKFSYKDMGQSLAELRKSKWLQSDMKNLFSDAYDQCAKHVGE